MSQKKKSSYTPKAIEDFDSSVLAEEIVEAVAVEELSEVEWLDEPIVVERPITITEHIVVKGDSLSSIAHMYCPANMDVDNFYRHLNLMNNRPTVSVGQVVKVFGGN